MQEAYDQLRKHRLILMQRIARKQLLVGRAHQSVSDGFHVLAVTMEAGIGGLKFVQQMVTEGHVKHRMIAHGTRRPRRRKG